MSAEIHTTIDVAPLLAMRERFADQLDEIAERLSADDPDAYETALRMLEVEETAVAAVVEQFRRLCGESVQPESYVDSFREALDGLRVTGDLYAHVDYYNARQRYAEVIDAIPVLLDHLAASSDYWGGEHGEIHRQVIGIELTEAIRGLVHENQYVPAAVTS